MWVRNEVSDGCTSPGAGGGGETIAWFVTPHRRLTVRISEDSIVLGEVVGRWEGGGMGKNVEREDWRGRSWGARDVWLAVLDAGRGQGRLN